MFYAEGVATKEHHWQLDRWEEEVRHFLDENFPGDYTTQDLYATILLLYPAFGETEKKYAASGVLSKLKENGDIIYNQIFKGNRKPTILMFFKDSFIRKLWSKIVAEKDCLEYKHCFSNEPVQKIIATYSEITRIVTQEHNLPVPMWWQKRFPLRY